MTIYLLDLNSNITQSWNKCFTNLANIIQDDFKHFMDNHTIDCVVSPGNSKGIMAGGYDLAITKYFGWDLTKKVQKYIIDNFHGLQPVGSAFITDIPNSNVKLIHCPTMISPSVIKDTKVIYNCMLNTLKVAKANNIQSIVIPAFGGATGQVSPEEIAKQMYLAYQDWIKE